jgi:hypothetical protein
MLACIQAAAIQATRAQVGSTDRLTAALDVLLACTAPNSPVQIDTHTRDRLVFYSWSASDPWAWEAPKIKETKKRTILGPQILICHEMCQIVAEYIGKMPTSNTTQLRAIVGQLE